MRAAWRSPARKCSRAIARGVSVFQGDIDEGLADYPDRAFDYVILSQTLQETRHPRKVLREMLRVGRRGDRGLPQFRPLARAAFHAGQRARAAHQAVPLRVVRLAQHPLPHGGRFRGRWPRWRGCTVERRYFLAGHRKVTLMPNLLAEVAVFLVSAG